MPQPERYFHFCLCVPDLSDLTDHVQQLETDLKALTCQLANLKNNGENEKFDGGGLL
jgi:hypothetical protein